MDRRLTFPRWNDVLVELYKSKDSHRYSERLNRVIKGSLTHLREVIRILVQNNLVEIKLEKKAKMLCLTEKGERITHSLLSIREELGSSNGNRNNGNDE